VATGPLVGGALTQGIDWHWIFWANVPLGVVGVLLSARLLPRVRARVLIARDDLGLDPQASLAARGNRATACP
jgi:MFS family permease